MAITTHEREIDGIRYGVTLFDMTQALEKAQLLITTFGPSLASLSIDDPVGAIEALTKAIHEGRASLPALVTALLPKVTIDGQKMQGETAPAVHFAGKLGHLIKVLSFVIEVNFSDFFDELRSAMQALRPAPPAETSDPSPSPTT